MVSESLKFYCSKENYHTNVSFPVAKDNDDLAIIMVWWRDEKGQV